MRAHMTLGMVVLAVIPLTAATAMPSIRLLPPPPGQLRFEHLWRVEINNPDDTTYRVYLHGEVHEAAKDLVFRANSQEFDLPKGKKTMRSQDITALRDEWHAPGYEVFKFRSGSLPEGEYEYFVVLMPLGVGDTGKVKVRLPGPPRLISPPDGDTVRTKYPLFVWTPPMPPPEGKVTYELRIVEILPGQTKEQAWKANQPWFENKDIRAVSFRYPVSARELAADRDYCWGVVAKPRGTVSDESFAPHKFSMAAPSEVTDAGSIKWVFDPTGHVEPGEVVSQISRPALDRDGRIYVTVNTRTSGMAAAAYLFCLRDDGDHYSVVSLYRDAGAVYSCPAVGSDGEVYVLSHTRYLYLRAFTVPLEDGALWRIQTSSGPVSPPAPDFMAVAIGLDRTVYSLSATDEGVCVAAVLLPPGPTEPPSVLWYSELPPLMADELCLPTIGPEGEVYITTTWVGEHDREKIAAFDSYTGVEVWSGLQPEGLALLAGGPLAIDEDGCVYVTACDLAFVPSGAEAKMLVYEPLEEIPSGPVEPADIYTGFNIPYACALYGEPVIVDTRYFDSRHNEQVIVGSHEHVSESGMVTAKGEFPFGVNRWGFRPGSGIQSAGAIGTEPFPRTQKLYIGSRDGQLHAINLNDAGPSTDPVPDWVEWQTDIGGIVGDPAIGDHTVYVNTINWPHTRLVAVHCTSERLDDDPRWGSPWPKWGHDNQNTRRAKSVEVEHSYELCAGWNFLSIPVTSTSAYISDLLPCAIPNASFAYDPTSAWYPIIDNVPMRGSAVCVGLGPDPEATTTVTVRGQPYKRSKQPLKQGWNFLGSVDREGIPIPASLLERGAWRYSRAAGAFLPMSEPTLDPGHATAVWVPDDGILTTCATAGEASFEPEARRRVAPKSEPRILGALIAELGTGRVKLEFGADIRAVDGLDSEYDWGPFERLPKPNGIDTPVPYLPCYLKTAEDTARALLRSVVRESDRMEWQLVFERPVRLKAGDMSSVPQNYHLTLKSGDRTWNAREMKELQMAAGTEVLLIAEKRP